ncbi:unnamed protein product [Withania somnifera]
MENHIFLLILLFLIPLSISAASSNETDRDALLAFQNLITSPNHFLANNWTKNTSFCSWFGVACSSRRQRVVALSLPSLQLQGTISPSLANLSFLRELNLENNNFHGGIPYGLGHLPRLRVIDIQSNQLQGSIPTSLFQHQKVQKISLAYNELSGEMWKGPLYVPELRVLNLRNNSLTGIIPPSVGNATKLMNFSLYGNRVSGNIPKEIGNLSQLAFLSLADNLLIGSIPATLFNILSLLSVSLGTNSLSGPLFLDEGSVLSNLNLLSISDNQISGGIPSNICQLKELNILAISHNKITGDIPRNINCLSKLKVFYIGYNQIKGTIPTSLGNISSLQYLNCRNNHLDGPIPPELGKLSSLRLIGFAQNYNLIGQIPKRIFNISSLEIIDFGFNKLSGRIPDTTSLRLPNLKELYLASNQLEGKIPLFITNASKLEILELAGNFLTGTIPTNLGNLRDLRGLLLHTNQFTNEPREHELRFFNSLADCMMLQYLEVGSNPLNGVLPNSIGNLSSTIESLYLADAHISGFIPIGIGNMSGLTTLDFQINNLTGNIPPEIGKLKQLQGLSLTNNKLQGHIPGEVCHLSNLVQLYLGDNELTGMIPECFGNLSMLQKIYLDSNKLSSKFPLSLWKMSGLLSLSVSRNSIKGEVPSDIGELKAILDLDLSGNHFRGMIPSRLGDLQTLQYLDLLEFLDLSTNALSGTIPKSLEKLSHLRRINVSFNDLGGQIPSGGVFANSTLQSFLGNRGLCGMHILEVPACSITNLGQQPKLKVVVLKIVTPVIISSFLIFLSVSIWITKRRRNESQKMWKRYRRSGLINYAEKCRHRNLVSVITTCSSDYIRAFVLQFMPNGSLENWLYKEDCHLNLLQRVTVMHDVAMAMEYLHHGNDTPIIHCDLKPANILLDEDMVAHVGDFGISKILAVSKSVAHTETLGTLGYIAPEYGSEGIVSTSGDVYSYGIMLMEVLSKRRPTDKGICNENLDLRKWIIQAFPGTMLDIVDDNLFSREEQITCRSEICIVSMIELALDCTKETPESRITMKDVVKRLNKIKNAFLAT